ncbi:MAG: redoxin domain-containing protein [Spirochaetes bacterium]|nr:redoxin domain-containing protein [Spirochaetota bacterium]
MKKLGIVLTVLVFVASLAPVAMAQVLGPCGTTDAQKPGAAVAAAAQPAAGGLTISPVPLPGDQAPNFELPAVVGDQVKNIKLSDYEGKWRVVCFYPADFTFV